MNEDKFDNMEFSGEERILLLLPEIMKEFVQKIGEQKDSPSQFEETFQKHIWEILA